jgi:hypothetical protein
MMEKDKEGQPSGRASGCTLHSGHSWGVDIFVLRRDNEGLKPTFLTVRSVISLIAGGFVDGVGMLG